MAKVHKFSDDQFGITCLACGCGHELKGWQFNGDLESPTFSPSLLVTGKKMPTQDEADRIMADEKIELSDMVCHSFIRNGNIEYLSDCTHEYAGKTVKLNEFADYDSPIIEVNK